MGTGNLSTRADGQTITQSWFNDLNAALELDFVGRNASGVPVAGNNLGTALYPWGNIFASQLVVGGSTFNVSNLESDPFQILSGKSRTTSTQPAFMIPVASSLNFSILGASVTLSLSINGQAVSISSDLTQSMTAGPSTNHTCTVNDSALTGNLASRAAGEYGQTPGSTTGSITVSGAGSAIVAAVGKWKAFKIVHSAVTEYFLAYVASSTSLTNCLRGYFVDSSGNPINRVPVSNGDTITMLSVGWVFVDVNGSTVDTTYNVPTVDYNSPSSPASGDYWLDISNTTWKRYNGSTWVSVTRMPVGMVCADSSNCVGARSFNFYAVPREDNTLELSYVSTTQLQAIAQGSRVNVNGKRLFYQFIAPKWDSSSNLATSPDMYFALKQNSWVYYVYLSEKGQEFLSDISPYFRPDLLGYYHPHNTWRCLGQISTDSSGNFVSTSLKRIRAFESGGIDGATQLIDLSVTQAKLAPSDKVRGGNSGSASYGNSTPTLLAGVGMSKTFTGTRLARIRLEPSENATYGDSYVSLSVASPVSYFQNGILDLYDGSTQLMRWFFGPLIPTGTASALVLTPIFEYEYVPSAGSHTYAIKGWISAGGAVTAVFAIVNYTITAFEY